MSSQLVTSRLASRQASLMFASGANVNLFENEPHAVLNPYNNELKEMTKQGQDITAFNQGIIRWEVPKFEDCFKTGFLTLTTAAATGATVEAFCRGYGYHVFRRIYIQLTNNPYTAEFEVPYFMYDRHQNKYNSRQFMDFVEPSMLLSASLAARQQALARGHTAIVPLEVGQAYEGFENMFWISPLAHNLMIYAQLANASDVIYDPAASGANITNLGTLITDTRLFLSTNTVDDDARAVAIATYNSDDGLYNFMREPRIYQFDLAQSNNGVVTLTMNETRPFTMMTIFYEDAARVQTAWQKEYFQIAGPGQLSSDAVNTVVFPRYFELVGSGDETIIKKRDVMHQLEFEHREKFVDKEAGSWVLNVSPSVFDPLKDNTINGPIDPNVYSSIKLNLYFSGWVRDSKNPAAALPANVTSTPAGSGARVTVLFHTFNFVHNAKADANKTIA